MFLHAQTFFVRFLIKIIFIYFPGYHLIFLSTSLSLGPYKYQYFRPETHPLFHLMYLLNYLLFPDMMPSICPMFFLSGFHIFREAASISLLPISSIAHGFTSKNHFFISSFSTKLLAISLNTQSSTSPVVAPKP